MEIRNGKVILRDFVDTDIEDRIHWETVETEWQLWDAPWEYEQDEKPFDPEQYRSKMLERLSREKDECRLRSGFQICIDNPDRTHIGWCNAYRIDDQYNYTKDGGVLRDRYRYPSPERQTLRLCDRRLEAVH